LWATRAGPSSSSSPTRYAVVPESITETEDQYLPNLQDPLTSAAKLDTEDSLWITWHDLVPLPRLASVVSQHRSMTTALLSALDAGTEGLRDPLERDSGLTLEEDVASFARPGLR
jgi:hypothetical protein